MAVRSVIVTVTTQPTLLMVGDDNDTNPSFRDAVVKNTGNAVLYVGGSDVDTDSGFPVAIGEALALDSLAPDSLLYGRVASGSMSISVLQVGV